MWCPVSSDQYNQQKNYFNNKFHFSIYVRSHGVMVSTLDFESSDPSSNLGGTFGEILVFTRSLLFNTTQHNTTQQHNNTTHALYLIYVYIFILDVWAAHRYNIANMRSVPLSECIKAKLEEKKEIQYASQWHCRLPKKLCGKI